ncbi:MAG TPA: M48 family metallopeptidase [Xanthomarina sp.]|nr:M48 family metallopeptidase [Xanthomarina sp.]
MKLKKILSVFVLFMIVMACSTNPFTGKQTMALVPNSQLFPTAFQQYNQVLSESNVETGTERSEMIKRTGQRIAVAAERWLNANGHQGYLKDYKWEYNLIDDKTVNAWCMPGGKIVFYTGILPIAQSETGVAAIMGHEVAHALANHGQQRMSADYIQQGVALAGNIAIQNDNDRAAFNQYYGIGSQVGVMLPFSRSHEAEADKIGLILMALAGYNPSEAAELWKRMEANSGGNAPPEILSTHPSNASRIQNIQSLVPMAVSEAKKFGVTSFRPITKF